MAEERAGYRWGVLLNTFLVFSIAFGMGWTYIVMVAAEVIQDLTLTLMDWGTLWSAVGSVANFKCRQADSSLHVTYAAKE